DEDNDEDNEHQEEERREDVAHAYFVEKYLGCGGYGKVAQCTRLDNKVKMAVKIVRNDMTWAGKREVAVLQKLRKLDQDKNNLVRFAEHFEYKGHVCLAFEMLDINIYDFIRSRDFQPLHLSEIRVITQQMLVALNALKSVGLSHADVKPDNIMLVNHHQQPFRVKLIDFGLAANVSKIHMQGLPDDHLLNSGIYSSCFFSKDKDSSNPSWRLNTEAEYMLLTGSKTRRYRGIFDKLTSLNDVTKTRPEVNDTTEFEDTQAFLSLLKRMLQVDPQKRITLSEALGHRFITMKHFPHDANPNPYMSAAFSTIKKCQLEESSVKFKHFVTSKTASCPSDERPPTRSLDEAKTTNDGTPATADRTAKGNNKSPPEKAGLDDATAAETNQKPLHLNEATSPASDLHDSAGDSRSTDERTKGFVQNKEKIFEEDSTILLTADQDYKLMQSKR
uniref:Protein kinase domain-containing protein n=1 Tax=Seriola lalandi dorsalis TaxID=1841481 RepID=A0A3B4WZ50_SERLL